MPVPSSAASSHPLALLDELGLSHITSAGLVSPHKTTMIAFLTGLNATSLPKPSTQDRERGICSHSENGRTLPRGLLGILAGQDAVRQQDA
jgi:hypothetical protein